MSEPARFSLKRKEIEIILEDDNGTSSTYFLKELKGIDRDRYYNRMQSKIKIDSDGKTTVKDFTGIHSEILSLSLFSADGKAVDDKTIQQWPASTQEGLSKMALELSGLTRKAEEEAKND